MEKDIEILAEILEGDLVDVNSYLYELKKIESKELLEGFVVHYMTEIGDDGMTILLMELDLELDDTTVMHKNYEFFTKSIVARNDKKIERLSVFVDFCVLLKSKIPDEKPDDEEINTKELKAFNLDLTQFTKDDLVYIKDEFLGYGDYHTVAFLIEEIKKRNEN